MRIDNTIGYLIDDVGGPLRAAKLCKVHRTTVYRWLRNGSTMPHTAYRTLYHASQWGRGERHVWSVNAARINGQLIDALQAAIKTRDAEIARLVRLGGFGCANAPIYRMVMA